MQAPLEEKTYENVKNVFTVNIHVKLLTLAFVAFIYSPLSAVVMEDGDGVVVLRRGGGQHEVTRSTRVCVARQDADFLLTGWIKSRTEGEPHGDRETRHKSTEGPLNDPRQAQQSCLFWRNLLVRSKRSTFIVF